LTKTSATEEFKMWRCSSRQAISPEQHRIFRNWSSDQEYSFRWLEGVIAVWQSSIAVPIWMIGSKFSSSESWLNLGTISQHHHLIGPQYQWLYPWLEVGRCYPEEGSSGHHK
jgi:hypothetical protein